MRTQYDVAVNLKNRYSINLFACNFTQKLYVAGSDAESTPALYII